MLIINLADIQHNVHNINLLFLSIALEICLPTGNVIFKVTHFLERDQMLSIASQKYASSIRAAPS